MTAIVTALARAYGVLWLVALWLPFLAWPAAHVHVEHFTWWCWLLQAAFYTLTHPWLRHRLHLRHYWLALSMVCGNVVFVLAAFCVVLLRHPTIVVEVQGHPLGVVQLANVGLHYVTIAAFLLWTLFDVDHLRHMLRTQVTTAWRALAFVMAWLALPALYVAAFGPAAIAHSYGIPADAGTHLGMAASVALALQFNVMYLYHLRAAPSAAPSGRALRSDVGTDSTASAPASPAVL